MPAETCTQRMDRACAQGYGEESNVIRLADYRRSVSRPDGDRPPPSPRPAAAARQAVPMPSLDLLGSADLLENCKRSIRSW